MPFQAISKGPWKGRVIPMVGYVMGLVPVKISIALCFKSVDQLLPSLIKVYSIYKFIYYLKTWNFCSPNNLAKILLPTFNAQGKDRIL
jgi:hypothetical protein